MNGVGSGIFFRTSLAPFIAYILVIKIGLAVFEKTTIEEKFPERKCVSEIRRHLFYTKGQSYGN